MINNVTKLIRLRWGLDMKETKKLFYQEALQIAVPITIQSLFQSALSVIDQMMVGSLGSISIAGIGLGGKFVSLFTTTVAALGMAAGILMAQYYGAKDEKGLRASFHLNLLFALAVSMIFMSLSLSCPKQLMTLYSMDQAVIESGAAYLRILAMGFIPMTITLMLSTLLRSIGKAKMPMYASVSSVILNTVLNYLLIYGKCNFPKLGLEGAALATTLARVIEMLWLIGYFIKVNQQDSMQLMSGFSIEQGFTKMVWKIIYPILLCEFFWSLGENIYASIYGRLGTLACAAMTLTGPIQSLVIGMFTGVSAATGIMVGNQLGANQMEEAYKRAKAFIKIGLIGTLCFSMLVLIIAPCYTQIFNVELEVRQLTIHILQVYALLVPVKVLNMIAEGGILRSGGKTHYTLILDFIGTWGLGVPLGLLGAYVLKWQIESVYFLLSLEEVFRLSVTLVLFKKRKWMNQLTK